MCYQTLQISRDKSCIISYDNKPGLYLWGVETWSEVCASTQSFGLYVHRYMHILHSAMGGGGQHNGQFSKNPAKSKFDEKMFAQSSLVFPILISKF